jgi:hypothetical protein
MINKQELIEGLIDEVIKSKSLNVEFILNELKKNPSFYLFYPYLFKNYFDVKNDLKKVSIAGFLYYLSILYSDNICDSNNLTDDEKFDKMNLIHSLTEHSIKILTSIFPEESVFWNLWSERKKDFHQIRIIEKDLKKRFTVKKYERLSDYKASFAKSAIDSCYVLGIDNSKEKHLIVLESQRLFSVGFQILDDLSDIRIDFKNNQVNIALVYAQKEGYFLQDSISNDFAEYYKTPLPIDILNLAHSYFIKAVRLIKKLDLAQDDHLWIKIIKQKIIDLNQKKISITDFVKVNSILKTQTSLRLGKENNSKSCDLIIKNAVEYVNEKFTGIYWEEYLTQGGISNYWSTSFVGYFLSDLMFDEQLKINLLQAKQNLISKQNFFSYNQNWQIEDVDSMCFGLLFLDNESLFNIHSVKLLKFQNSDGGFSTYNNHKQLEEAFTNENFSNFEGWSQSHQCVSSVALNLLYKYRNSYEESWKKLLNYILENYKKATVSAYWWTSNLYTQYFNLIVLQKLNKSNEIFFDIDYHIDKIKKQQNADGSFSDTFGKNLLYSALATNILMLNFEKHREEVEKSIYFIITNQYTDGSWDNSCSMRIPNPEISIPNDSGFLDIKSFGTNCRQLEFNRLFTSSVCINTLFKYNKNHEKYN